jgi:hypothetical protein
MNNMGREIMAALKRFQVGSDGDGVTVGGALVVSGATTANTISATIVNASGNATVGGTLVVTGATTFSGNVILSGTTTANTFSTDLITEKTSAAGVTIDGVLLKDSGVVTGAGTVSAPVYSTTGDLNTGIFFPAADTIAFAEGGAEAMRIDSSGNVGIGTTSPDSKLTVVDGTNSIVDALTTGGARTRMSSNASTGFSGTVTNHPFALVTNATERMRITSGGLVGIGNTSPAALLQAQGVVAGGSGGITANRLVAANANPGLSAYSSNDADTSVDLLYLRKEGGANNASNNIAIAFGVAGGDTYFVGQRIKGYRDGSNGNGGLIFETKNDSSNNTTTERARITSGGEIYFGTTDGSITSAGQRFGSDYSSFTSLAGRAIIVNRQNDDGDLMQFRQANTTEGSISVSGSTVSYNGGHLSRWAQMLTKPDLLKGTVMSNLDEMNVYIAPTTYWTEEDELPEGVNVGDVKVETHEVENEQLNKVKVSDVEGDANVAGVFVNWTYDEAHQVDEINMAMTGDMIIRIAQGTTVARGDLLMSAGDGTAKPQGDDIVRSKTIAKVTSTHVTCTYDDGSYCVPCVLMAC